MLAAVCIRPSVGVCKIWYFRFFFYFEHEIGPDDYRHQCVAGSVIGGVL